MFGETTISYVKIGNHPIETTIYKWLALGFQVVNFVGFGGVLGVSGIRHNREFFRNIHIAGAPMFVSNLPVKIRGCRFVPSGLLESKPQMVPRDLNIGFQGLALIQGQIYNPEIGENIGQWLVKHQGI